MLTPLFSLVRRPVVLAAVLLAVPCSAADAPKSEPLTTLDYSGDQRALEALDQKISTSSDAASLKGVATQLLGALKQKGITFASRQAICQRLGMVLGIAPDALDEKALAPLRAMLNAEHDVDLARLALERVPGAAVDQVFLDAFEKSAGRTRISLCQAFGKRRMPAAVPLLQSALGSERPDVAAAAAHALGEIGTRDALKALQSSPLANEPAGLAAVLQIASTLSGTEGAALARSIQQNAKLPLPARTSALHVALQADPAGATALIVSTITGTEWAMKETAIAAIATLRAPDLTNALVDKLGSLDAPTQAAVIAALGNRADAAAVPAITAALRHSDAEVRAAAIDALGTLPGSAPTVTALAEIISGSGIEDAKLARRSLARLNGPDIDATVAKLATTGAGPVRLAMLEQVGLRNMTEVLPQLRTMLKDQDPAIRGGAATALGEIGAPAADQALLIAAALGASDAAEITRASRALVTLTLRNPDQKGRSAPVIKALESAPPAAAAKVVAVLPRLGDSASAESAARLALSSDAALASAATAALGRWTDATALPSLGKVAVGTKDESNRNAAIRAAVRFLEGDHKAWRAPSSEAAVTLLRASSDPALRTQILRLLRRARDRSAESYVKGLTSDPAVGAEAKGTLEAIQANTSGKVSARSNDNTQDAIKAYDGDMSTRWSAPADAGQTIQFDLGGSRPINRLVIDNDWAAWDIPAVCEVYVTDDPNNPGSPRASTKPEVGENTITLPEGTRGRYLILKDPVGRDGWWDIHEIIIE